MNLAATGTAAAVAIGVLTAVAAVVLPRRVAGVGTAVAVSVIGAGVLLSAAGEVLCFIPNELGRALLHNERLTY